MQINPELVQEIKDLFKDVTKLTEYLKGALERKSPSSLAQWQKDSLQGHRTRIHTINHLIESLDTLSVAEVIHLEQEEEEEPPPDADEQFKLQSLEAIKALQDQKQTVMQEKSIAKAKQKALTLKQISLYHAIGVDNLTSRQKASLTKLESSIGDD